MCLCVCVAEVFSRSFLVFWFVVFREKQRFPKKTSPSCLSTRTCAVALDVVVAALPVGRKIDRNVIAVRTVRHTNNTRARAELVVDDVDTAVLGVQDDHESIRTLHTLHTTFILWKHVPAEFLQMADGLMVQILVGLRVMLRHEVVPNRRNHLH